MTGLVDTVVRCLISGARCGARPRVTETRCVVVLHTSQRVDAIALPPRVVARLLVVGGGEEIPRDWPVPPGVEIVDARRDAVGWQALPAIVESLGEWLGDSTHWIVYLSEMRTVGG